MNDDVLETASDVTAALFGPESGIPWWAWVFVVLAMFWKVIVPEPRTAQETREDRDRALIAEISGGGNGKKKGKKKK
jgi:hypothetical protein